RRARAGRPAGAARPAGRRRAHGARLAPASGLLAELVVAARGKVFEPSRRAARPADLRRLDLVRRAHPEEEPQGAPRVVRAGAAHLAHLRAAVRLDGDARADRVLVLVGAEEPEADPAAALRDPVLEQARRLVVAREEEIQVAVVVDVERR